MNYTRIFGVSPEVARALNERYGNARAEGGPVQGSAVAGPPLPYQPNPGLPNYNPNMGAAPAPIAPPPDEPSLLHRAGAAVGRAFSSPEPIFQVPSAGKPSPAAEASHGDVQGAGNVVDAGPLTPAPAEGSAAQMGQSFAPSYTVPAHWQPGTHETQVKRGWSGEELAPLQAGQKAAQSASEEKLGAAAQLGEMQGIAEARKAQVLAQSAQDFADQQKALQGEKQRYVDAKLRQMNELSAAASREIDPEQYWSAHGGKLGQVIAAISIGMGQFGASLTGGQNAAMQIIHGAIDRNIRAQEKNAELAGRKFDIEKNVYAMNLEAFGDRDIALKASQSFYYNAAISQVDAMLANAALPVEQKQRLAGIREQLANQKLAADKGVADLAHDQITEAQNERFIPAQTVTPGGGNPDAAKNAVVIDDGKGGKLAYKLPEGVTADTQKALQYREQVAGMDKRAIELRHTLATSPPGSAKYETAFKSLEVLQESRAEAESVARQMGVVRSDEMQRKLKEGFYLHGFSPGYIRGNLTKVNPLNDRDVAVGDNGIKESMAQNARDQKALVEGAGGYVVERGFTRDTKGNLQPTGTYTGQAAAPPDRVAPKGFKPTDPRKVVPTREASPADTAPQLGPPRRY